MNKPAIVTLLTESQDAERSARAIDISVITPIYNEEDSVPGLCARLFDALSQLGLRFEVIAVNDGSRDKSFEALCREALVRPQLKIVSLRRNFGQTAAMMAGVDHASGDVIVTIDADLQNDPADIGLLLAKLNEGFDVVSGWRRERKDAPIKRTFLSNVANVLISKISGVELKDYGCSLKAYRRDVIKGVRLYGEMHRFIPIYASWFGAKVVEIPVQHHARQFGESKYGMERMFKVVLDLIVVKFLDRYLVKPIYVFGGFGLLSAFASMLCFAVALGLKSVVQKPCVQA